MSRSTSIVRIAMLLACCFPAGMVQNGAYAQSQSENKSGWAPINGMKMYYEVTGSGKPLLLLHGAFMDINLTFSQLIPEWSKNRKVIAVELQGHGRTNDIDRPYTFASMADDVAAFLKYLKIDSADIFGYSMGGGVALQLAISHPTLVRRLVLASVPYKSEGWSPETRAVFPMIKPEFFEKTPIKTEYDKLAPDPTHYADWVNKLAKFAAAHFDFGSDQLKKIQAPTLLIFGDADGTEPEHIADMYRLFGGGINGDMGKMPRSQLAIFPGSTHVTLMMHPDWILSMTQAFLDKPAQ